MIKNAVIIGAGNLATQLALALHEKGIHIVQIYSRTEVSAKELADKLGTNYTSELQQLQLEADIYIIAVKDSAIQEILENCNLDEDKLIVHTAGSIPMSILEGFTRNYGVFYPLQTLSKNRKVDFSDIPICIEANHPGNLIKLEELGKILSITVTQINSEERKALHLAAVLANNFVNHFYSIGAEILHDQKIDFALLKPLIRETAAKIENMNPADAQTGPAKRNDRQVAEAHLKILSNKPEYQKIYSFVTESIFQQHQKRAHDLL
jgi:predicted short-subunit dehydrogenase-like oxidoreductase (DUF2520 family)